MKPCASEKDCPEGNGFFYTIDRTCGVARVCQWVLKCIYTIGLGIARKCSRCRCTAVNIRVLLSEYGREQAMEAKGSVGTYCTYTQGRYLFLFVTYTPTKEIVGFKASTSDGTLWQSTVLQLSDGHADMRDRTALSLTRRHSSFYKRLALCAEYRLNRIR